MTRGQNDLPYRSCIGLSPTIFRRLALAHRASGNGAVESFGTATGRMPAVTSCRPLRLFTPDILDRINQEVVRTGHRLLNVSAAVGLNARCDSFVVKTEVHFPTVTNLLFDAIRKTIPICAFGCMQQGWSEWRQVGHITRKLKMAYRHIQKLKHSTSKDEDKRQAKQKEIGLAHKVYLARVHDTDAKLAALGTCGAVCDEIAVYIGHARRQIEAPLAGEVTGWKIFKN